MTDRARAQHKNNDNLEDQLPLEEVQSINQRPRLESFAALEQTLHHAFAGAERHCMQQLLVQYDWDVPAFSSQGKMCRQASRNYKRTMTLAAKLRLNAVYIAPNAMAQARSLSGLGSRVGGHVGPFGRRCVSWKGNHTLPGETHLARMVDTNTGFCISRWFGYKHRTTLVCPA